MSNTRLTIINKLVEKLMDIINVITAILMVLLTLVVFLEVFSRYVFNLPIAFSGELTQLIFPWLIFLAAIVVTKSEGHLSINYFRSLFPKRMQKILLLISKLVMLYFSFFMVISSFKLTETVNKQVLPMLHISKSWLYVSGIVSFTGVVLILIYQVILLILNKIEPPREEDMYDLDYDR